MSLPALRADRLVAAREAAGFSREELAARTGVSQVSLRMWEGGATSRPRPRLIPPLAAALGVDPLELLDINPADPPLAALRLAAGKTTPQLALAAGVPMMSYRQYEVGTVARDPAPQMVAAVAAALGRTVEQTAAAFRRSRDDR